jgi:catechol 2,3-dioxygenase-like lactoylglutathione lyase family enzyme
MTTKLEGGLVGVDHVAYATWKPEETVHFYRDVLGFPLAHAIIAPGWGNDPHPDFVHFFFDIGAGGRLAFFYYFGVPPYEDQTPDRLKRARHLALLVDTEEELDGYQRRLEDAGYQLRFRLMHELIESIYVWDPNGYSIEISRKLRPLTDADTIDTALSMQALIDVCREPEPTLEKLWARKGRLIVEQEHAKEKELTRG